MFIHNTFFCLWVTYVLNRMNVTTQGPSNGIAIFRLYYIVTTNGTVTYIAMVLCSQRLWPQLWRINRYLNPFHNQLMVGQVDL